MHRKLREIRELAEEKEVKELLSQVENQYAYASRDKEKRESFKVAGNLRRVTKWKDHREKRCPQGRRMLLPGRTSFLSAAQ